MIINESVFVWWIGVFFEFEMNRFWVFVEWYVSDFLRWEIIVGLVLCGCYLLVIMDEVLGC